MIPPGGRGTAKGRAKRPAVPRGEGSSPGFPAPAYLVVANDPLLLREAEREIVDALVPPEARSMSLMALEGFEADPGAVTDFLQTFSFFGGRKVFVIRDVEECKGWKELLPYLRDPNPASCLVMTSALLKGRDHKAKFTALSAVAGVIERKRPAGRFLAEWVRRRFAAGGKIAGDEVVRALVESVGNDLSTLASETEKIILFAGEEERIAPAHLAVSLAGSGEGNIFTFLDAVADRDRPGALRLGREMLEAGARMEQLVAMLARSFRQLLRGKGMSRKGMSAVAAARELGMAWPFLQEKFARQLDRWEEGDLLAAVETLSAGDLAVKRGRLPADVVLDDLLLRLFRR